MSHWPSRILAGDAHGRGQFRDCLEHASATTNTVLRFDRTVGPAAFSLDGTMLALQRGHFDIELFKVQTWERLGALIGHQHVINQIAFAPDGKTLASVAIDGSVRLWSVRGCEEVAVLYDHRDSTETVAFTVAHGND